MLTLLWLLGLVLIVAVLAWKRSSLLNACVVVAAYLLAMTCVGALHRLLDLLRLALLLGVAVPLNRTHWRRRSLPSPLFHWFRQVLPPRSDTEPEALEAGTVWWDGELFSG